MNVKELTKRRRKYYYLSILRAFALIAVSTYHLFAHAFPGGFLAVIGFLSMSGFLMEMTNDRYLSLEDILASIKNRIKKILPPIIFVMAISLLISLIFAREIFDDSAKSSLATTFCFENIRQIIAGASYFDRNGNFNLFIHLWYISIYVQFILIFYLLKFIGRKINSDTIKLILLSLLTIGSIGLSYYLANKDVPIIRIYYGTDTRIYAFFLGMIFYLLYKNYGRYMEISKLSLKIIVGVLGILLFVPMFFINGENINIYKTFFLIYTLAFNLLIFFIFKLENSLDKRERKLGWGGSILVFIGSRSLHYYILQYIIQVFFSYFLINIFDNKIIYYGLQIAWIIFLGEISHAIFSRKKLNKYLVIIPFVSLIIFNIISLAIGNKKKQEMAELKARFEQSQEEIKKHNELQKKKNTEKDPKALPKEDEKDKEVSKDKKESKKADSSEDFKEKAYDDFDFTENELAYVKDVSVSAVGDSVLINIDKYLRNYMPNLYLDGKVGRDMPEGPGILQAIKNNVGLGDIVLISLGSNGSANHNDMQAIMDIADGRDVYFVNTSHLQSYMDKVNSDLEAFVNDNPKAHLIDWRSYVKDRPELLAVDRTHPNVEGSQAYADLVIRKILNENKVRP
ncbi:acyltransferase family protein [uncultured Anaerococcus sp.]|uniref:acyltransferase family protein n=1 Tax=uncultured Anaerococcus sp. TaxID=293428 RepID=UPI00288BF657|nr:acyltransferase family protein [uncultured Anaerococcus sp.]